jgi:hypothetical protein
MQQSVSCFANYCKGITFWLYHVFVEDAVFLRECGSERRRPMFICLHFFLGTEVGLGATLGGDCLHSMICFKSSLYLAYI